MTINESLTATELGAGDGNAKGKDEPSLAKDGEDIKVTFDGGETPPQPGDGKVAGADEAPGKNDNDNDKDDKDKEEIKIQE